MQKIHRKVLDKGIPPDVMPGIKGTKVIIIDKNKCLYKLILLSVV